MGKTPKKTTKSASKKKTVKKSAVKKAAAKKTTVKKVAVKKPTVKKTAAKKKTSTKKAAVKKTAKKTTAKKKTASKKTTKKAVKKTAKKTASETKKKVALKTAKADSTLMGSLSGELASRVVEDQSALDLESKKFEVDFRELSSATQSDKPAPPAPRELTDLFSETNVTLMVRDPEWIFVYWEVDAATRERYLIPRGAHTGTLMLRWYDITDLPEFDGTNAHRTMNVEVNDDIMSWYQHVPEPHRCWCVDFGVLDSNKEFLPICRSNVVRTPREGLAEPQDVERWMRVLPDDPRQMILEAPTGMRPQSDWASVEGASSHGTRKINGEEIRSVGANDKPTTLAHGMGVEELAKILSSERLVFSGRLAPSSTTFSSESSRPPKPSEEEH